MSKHQFNRPCIMCGTLTREGSYCPDHKSVRQPPVEQQVARAEKKAKLYDSSYRKRAKAIRESAQACHICGRGSIQNDPWQADHLLPGDPQSPLAPAHRSCNASRGNKEL